MEANEEKSQRDEKKVSGTRREEKKRNYVDDGCEQSIFQLKYQEPNKR